MESATTTQMPHDGSLPGATRRLALIPVMVVFGAALTTMLYLFPPPSVGLVLVGGLCLISVLALAIARYEAAALLGFLTLSVVIVDPAPPDAVFAIVIAVATVTGRFDISRVAPAFAGLLGTLIALNLISMVEVIDFGRAALFFSITVFLAIFALWLCSFVSSAERARVVVVGYVATATASAIVSSLALVIQFPGSEYLLLDGCCRAQGLFQDANVFGPFLVPPALIVIQETFEPRLLRMRAPLKILIALILLAGVLLSFSRGAWINAAVGLAVMFAVMVVRRGGLRRGAQMLTVLMVVGAGLVAVLSFTGSTGFLGTRAHYQAYDSERFSAQRTGIELAYRNPLGIGPGQFEVISPLATHSTYVRVLAEQGIVGFGVLLALLVSTLLVATRNALVGRHSYGIGSAALLGAWCGILVNSLVVDALHWRHLWIVAALIWVGAMRLTLEHRDSHLT